MKPYYEQDGITIYHGDCREFTDWPDGPIVTDPPYGIAHPGNFAERKRGNLARRVPAVGCGPAACNDYPDVYDDDKPFDPAWMLALDRPLVLFGANWYADKLHNTGGWLVWDKMRPHDLDQATAELAWTNFVKGVRVFRYLWNGCMRDGRENMVHPTQKPVALFKWIFALKWFPAGTVIDPYMGSGPCLQAAKESGKDAIGVEIEERYCEVAAKRLSQQVLQFSADSP